ncbi:unnamed protein product [Prorocentrum cordatum]|uniref:DUF4116 domain-containing protein n=1 Tax=Prorocentrum cordatum TaxID=2364126 RepID=A0ABN9VKW1_9DINO|nr:unnamed protein product [Polarella glacialis]
MDRGFLLDAAERHAGALLCMPMELRGERSFALEAAARRGGVLAHLSEDLRADREVVSAAVGQDGLALEYATPELRADRQLVLIAVEQCGLALQHADGGLMGDREVVLAAVSRHWEALAHAEPALQADDEVVLAAVAQNGAALELAAPELRRDRAFTLKAVASIWPVASQRSLPRFQYVHWKERTLHRSPHARSITWVPHFTHKRFVPLGLLWSGTMTRRCFSHLDAMGAQSLFRIGPGPGALRLAFSGFNLKRTKDLGCPRCAMPPHCSQMMGFCVRGPAFGSSPFATSTSSASTSATREMFLSWELTYLARAAYSAE